MASAPAASTACSDRASVLIWTLAARPLSGVAATKHRATRRTPAAITSTIAGRPAPRSAPPHPLRLAAARLRPPFVVVAHTMQIEQGAQQRSPYIRDPVATHSWYAFNVHATKRSIAPRPYSLLTLPKGTSIELSHRYDFSWQYDF